MPSKFTITYTYFYEDCESVEVVAETLEEAEAIADQEREGPAYAWNHASLMSEDWQLDSEEELEDAEV